MILSLLNMRPSQKLYLPADRVSVLQKYAGAEEKSETGPTGGTGVGPDQTKGQKIRQEDRQTIGGALRPQKISKGFRFSPPDHYFREFEAAFEHEETDDQSKAIDDVLEDLSSDKTMDRLICGDVGFGKTEIAIRAAFKAVSDGKQVAFLVPTTVLAEQHYETFQKRMTPTGFGSGSSAGSKLGGTGQGRCGNAIRQDQHIDRYAPDPSERCVIRRSGAGYY
jgi:transcription-repair coupling factor (superfamily II helicase)